MELLNVDVLVPVSGASQLTEWEPEAEFHVTFLSELPIHSKVTMSSVGAGEVGDSNKFFTSDELLQVYYTSIIVDHVVYECGGPHHSMRFSPLLKEPLSVTIMPRLLGEDRETWKVIYELF